MKVKASFINFNFREKIHLTNIISINNAKQDGVAFKAFITLINQPQYEEKLSRLTLIDTTYLNRHYEPLLVVEQSGKTPWLERNEATLAQLKIPYEIVSWEELVKAPSYQACKKKIDTDYYGSSEGFPDETFKNIVDDLSNNFVTAHSC